MYNVYITCKNEKNEISMKAFQKVNKVIVYRHLVTIYYTEKICETVSFDKIINVDVIEENEDNEQYHLDRG